MIVIRIICTGERLQTFLISLPPLVLLLHSNCDIQMSPTLVRSSVVPVFVLLPILRLLLFIVVRFGVIFSATVNAGAFRSIIHGCVQLKSTTKGINCIVDRGMHVGFVVRSSVIVVGCRVLPLVPVVGSYYTQPSIH